jgi:Fungal Zn(2)-Cys(6) binuclear cluster domain
MSQSVNASNLFNSSNISELLRQKRKHRPQRACQPCRVRKVKCSYDLPCKTCVERDHPELCTYDHPSKRSNPGVTLQNQQSELAESLEDDSQWMPSRSEWSEMRSTLNGINGALQTLQRNVNLLLQASGSQQYQTHGTSAQSPEPFGSDAASTGKLDAQGVPTNNVLTGEEVYVGSNSVPAMALALSRADGNQAVQELLGKSVLPIFALDNESATYPFVDLWGVPHGSTRRLELLGSVLPSDSDCHHIFRQYRDTAYVIYPVIVDIDQFEGQLTEFLTQRRAGFKFSQDSGLPDQLVFGKSVHWLGLLFALLASGFQSSDLPRKERNAKSQVYSMSILCVDLADI